MIVHASNYTNVAASATDTQILTGGTIKVMGIVVENSTGGGRVLIEENDGSTLIVAISCPAGDTKEVHIPFVAKNGIKVTTPANTTCTVFHTQVI